MTEHKGIWPDGSSGAKTVFCCPDPGCSDIPGVLACSHGRGEPVATVPTFVLPASLAEELAEALSECIETAEEGWAYASKFSRGKWECEREIAKAREALTRYRQAIGGDDGD